MADKTTGWVIELVAGQVVSPWDIKRLSEFIDVGVSERASLEAENRELQEKLTKFEEDGAKGKGYSGSSGMVHRIDILKKQAAVANARIAQLDRLNEALLRNRNYDPGAGNVLNGFLDERDRWKIKAEAAEAQVRELQWKPITPNTVFPAQNASFTVQVLLRAKDGTMQLWGVIQHHLADIIAEYWISYLDLTPPSSGTTDPSIPPATAR